MSFALHSSLDVGSPDVHAQGKPSSWSGPPKKLDRYRDSHRDPELYSLLRFWLGIADHLLNHPDQGWIDFLL